VKFNYQARTKKGEIQAGVVEASSKEAALSLLQKHGYFVTYLEEPKTPFYAQKLELLKGISLKDIVLFSRQISMMFSSKISLVESLRVLASQTKNTEFQEQVLDISTEVEGGSSFSKALSKYPKTFSILYVAMVKAGEESGKLAESLNYLADHLEREYNLAAKTKGALVYPALVLGLAVVVIYLMVNTVVPQLKKVLEESAAEIPQVTVNVLAISEIVRKYGLFIIVGLVLAVVLLLRYYKTEQGKKVMDKVLIKLPVIGPFLKTMYLSRLAESLSTLISGGLMVTKALELSADVIGNVVYREAILAVRDEVRKGVPISSVLALHPDLFPPIFVQMTLVGERTGSIDVSLMQVSTFYQAEVERGIDSILDILEPALIIGLGVVVGGLIFSVLMPLYQTMTI
jgi:type IV pilus assembly protein PilC